MSSMKKRQEQALGILEQLIGDGQLLITVGDDDAGYSKEATILSVYAGDKGAVCIDVQDPFAED